MILLGPSASKLDTIVSLLQQQFKISNEGDLCDYLGIQMKQRSDGTLELMQPHLIQSILHDLKLAENHPKSTPVPSLTSRILTQDSEGVDFDGHFDYCSVIRKLNYLEKSTRPEIAYAIHQCTRFCTAPKKSHGEAVKQISRYLLGTFDKGLILSPTKASCKCWADASHTGEWARMNADIDATTAKSRSGYVILYAGCPLIWASKLQTEIALSSTEAEYIALSQSL